MKQTFTAALIGRGPNGAWVHLDVPFSVEEVWDTRARIEKTLKMPGPKKTPKGRSPRGLRYRLVVQILPPLQI